MSPSSIIQEGNEWKIRAYIAHQLASDPSQVLERDLAGRVIVKQLEGLENFLIGVALGHLLGH